MKKQLLLLLFAMAALFTQAQNKPYITKVYELTPAPGQFINTMPTYVYVQNESPDSVIARAEKALCGTMTIEESELPDGTIVCDTAMNVSPGMISLGSYGGYVVFGFDHPVVNVKDEYDLQIFGNAFQAASSSSSGGSSEPGIVMVSRDYNGNGIPDDPWYELAGSEYTNPKTQKHFRITYYKPDDSQFPGAQNYPEYIRWTCNSVDSLTEGYVSKISFHSQSYWPQWVKGESLTFEGTKLPCNAVDESGEGTYWVQHFYDWGYVDNKPDNRYDGSAVESNMNLGFKIDWAVDDNGRRVNLHKIDFVKVYNGVLQQCGWLGETSTEVCGAIDLHPQQALSLIHGDVNVDGSVNVSDITALINMIMAYTPTDAELGDVNRDSRVNVSDITALIDIIMNS
ncbi:MAG: dockerin type I repeat-containing protein [Muribaculaceae bacterium]|nr:dockerin type I repeat-containing protein [Muribaculaceae bacterium]MBQ2491269.1 dockerin type I repeat-containing protein [Muribaculaceae bacterium]MBQ3960758.1 dockerin type I repeat-containing protein [Muribaculaceae bacterium]MBQ5465850.1 dockerin type I repeat-containing protein [Muribaculaceae bacterium]